MENGVLLLHAGVSPVKGQVLKVQRGHRFPILPKAEEGKIPFIDAATDDLMRRTSPVKPLEPSYLF